MEQNKPFYNSGSGVGVLLDGTVGMECWTTVIDGRKRNSLRIYPLEHKQKVGEREEDNAIIRDGAFIELTFGSTESIDVVIKALTIIKDFCNNDNKGAGARDL